MKGFGSGMTARIGRTPAIWHWAFAVILGVVTLAPAFAQGPIAPQYRVPIWPESEAGAVDIRSANGRVSLIVRDAPMNQVVSMLAQSQGFNLVCAADVSATVSIVLQDTAWSDALTAVLSTAGYTWAENNGIVHVTSVASGTALPPNVQGRRVQVFPLDYAAGDDVEKAVKGFLSPVGQVFLSTSSPTNLRKPKDVVVVEDLPGYMDRIAGYIAQIDHPPRQVLIEAQVLEVHLQDDYKHGINFSHLFSLAGNAVELNFTSMASLAPQAFFARVDGGNLESIVECLKSTTDSKMLASPRVLVVDGQEAKIQVGKKLSYRVTTTTETSTMENVQFLDVGVVLTVIPHISRDGRVLMKVKPKVSSGEISSETQLPEEKTSEVESNVLLEDGQGIIIGGLIQEKDSEIQSKIPILGDLWLLGLLFQRRHTEKYRAEVVIALVPRIQPLCGTCSADCLDVQRCQTPLLDRQLNPVDRPWETRFPDALRPPEFLRRRPVMASPPTVGEPNAPTVGPRIAPPGDGRIELAPMGEPVLQPAEPWPTLEESLEPSPADPQPAMRPEIRGSSSANGPPRITRLPPVDMSR